MENPIHQYELPKITDAEGNTPDVFAKFEKLAPPCGCVRLAVESSRIVEIDKRRVGASDAGTYTFIIDLTDDFFFEGQQKNTYALKIVIEYTSPTIIVKQVVKKVEKVVVVV
jgi:hypothetical protein